MPTPGPDLERGDGALKVPANPFAPSSPPPSSPPPANPPQHRTGNPLSASKPRPQSTHRRRSQHQRPISRIAPSHDPNAIPLKLLKLRTVMGISTTESLAASSPSSSKNPFNRRPAPNLGIYTRIIHEERSAKFQFYFASSVINACYFGQIIVAAALTALGASSSSNIAITVLGALNTVIAGILTYLKGQGLPNRLRMYWTGLRKCREFIEERERVFEAEGWGEELSDGEDGVDVDREIEVMVRMYHDVRQTAEDNVPDTYLPMQGHSASLLHRNGGATDAEKKRGSGLESVRYPDEDDYGNGDPEHDNDNDDVDDGPDKTILNPIHNANDVAPAAPETSSHSPDANTSPAGDAKSSK
ncbi:MAG: hypothetical protein Q9181_004439 [Wetmoreana brouardii]